jgi:hypothetical protein
MTLLTRLLQTVRQLLRGLLCGKSFDKAWVLHERGDTLAAAVAYSRLEGAKFGLALIALQLGRGKWGQQILSEPSAARAFVFWIVTRAKTAPMQFADPLVAAEAFLPQLPLSQLGDLSEFVARIPSTRGRGHYIAGLCLQALGQKTRAAASFEMAAKALVSDTRGLAAWVACTSDEKEHESIRTVCRELADENAAFALLLLESRTQSVSRDAVLNLAFTQSLGVRPLIEQFADRLPIVQSLLARCTTLAELLRDLRQQVASEIASIRAGNSDAIALIGMANMGRLGGDYLAPFTRFQSKYPMVFLVLASARVPELDAYPVPVIYVDECLLAQDHGFRLGIMDGANTMAVLLPDQMKLATVVHGAFTLPAAEKYFWADAASYFDFILLGGPDALRDVKEGLGRFVRTALGKTERVPNDLIDGSVTPARRRRASVFLVAAGQPRLDEQLARSIEAPSVPTVTFAPTAPQNLPAGMSAFVHAEKIIAYLLKRFPEWRVVFRPYPHALTEPLTAKIRNRFGANPQFEFDAGERSTAAVYRATTVFLTDASTGGFSFQAATLRPAVFFLPKPALFNRRFRRFLRQCRSFSSIAVSEKQIGDAVDAYLVNKAAFAERAKRFRQERVFHLGKSLQKYSQWLDQVMSNSPVTAERVLMSPARDRDTRTQSPQLVAAPGSGLH